MSRIQCPHCDKPYQLSPEQHAQYAGKKIMCKACQNAFTVPPPEGMAAPAPAAPARPAARPMQAAPSSPPPLPQRSAMEMYEERMHEGPPENNGWAKGALVAGIAGVFVPVVPALLAVGLGIAGVLKARKPNVGGKGIAILGMSIGLLAMVMHVLLVITLVPKVKTVIAVGKRVVCTAHIAMISQALDEYTAANNGAYPDSIAQLMATTPDLHPTTLVCPSTNDTPAPGATSTEQAAALKTPGHLSYVYVGKGLRAATQPAGAASTTQNGGDENASPSPFPTRRRNKATKGQADLVILYEPPANHGNGGMNVLWGDGRISYVSQESATKIISELKAGHNPPAKPPGGWKTESDGLIPD
jgi:prepilin-type processing-associated H-X9-DG protein